MPKIKSLETRKKIFSAKLDELLEELDLFMDLRLKVSSEEIKPLLIVDDISLLKREPEIKQLTKKDVKQKKQEQRPVKKSKKGKGKN